MFAGLFFCVYIRVLKQFEKIVLQMLQSFFYSIIY